MRDLLHKFNMMLGPFITVFWWCFGVCVLELLCYLAFGEIFILGFGS